MSKLICRHVNCGRTADRIIALHMPSVNCVLVSSYCKKHGDDIINEGRGVFAAGSALSGEAVKIEGVRR